MPAAGAVFGIIALLVASRAPQLPPGQPAATPTALILERVVDGGSGRPVAAAIVTVNGAVAASVASDPRGVVPTTTIATPRIRAMTNAGGQFVLSENRAPRAAGPRRILSARTANNVRGSIEISSADGEKKVQALNTGGGLS